MTYEQALEKYPELGDYSLSELNLIVRGMELATTDFDNSTYAIIAVIEHMEDTLAGA